MASGLSLTGGGITITEEDLTSGTVTDVSVVTANGLAGSVATSTTTPAITLSTSVTGVVKGNGTALSAAVAGTDYVVPGGALGTPSSGTATNITGLPVGTGISGLGTGVATALAVNVGSAGAPVVFNGAGGTPSSLTLTNATGLPVAGGGTGLGTLTANNVILGNGTSAVQFVAPGTSGNVLTSNGTTWASTAASGNFVLLSVLTASSSATLDNTTNITSAYDAYFIEYESVLPATDAVNLLCRFTTDGGSSWIATNYAGADAGGVTTGIVVNQPALFGGALAAQALRNTASFGFCGSSLLINPNSSVYKTLTTTGTFGTTGAQGAVMSAGAYLGATTAINGIRWLMSSGDIASGKIRIYGVKTA